MNITSKELKRMGFDDIAPIRRSKMGNTPTVYDGVQYKSKLEARFACMLDHWVHFGVISEWQYEPESMIFPWKDKHGKAKDIEYIPDFRVVHTAPAEVWYYETKGQIQQYDLTKWELFKEHRTESLCIVFAAKLKIGQGRRGNISTWKHGKMKRVVDRIWENVNQEFKKRTYNMGDLI